MSKSFDYRQKLVLIGICVLTSVLMFFFGFNYLKGMNVFSSTNTYYATFSDIQGVDRATKVMLNGYKVGNVRKITFDYRTYKGAVVELALDKSLAIPEGTQALIRNNPLGGGSVHLHLPEHIEGYLSVKDTIWGTQEVDLLSKLNNELIPNVNAAILSMDSLVGTMQGILEDPNIGAILSQLNGSTRAIQSSTRKLDRLMDRQVPDILDHVERTSSSLEQVSTTLEQAELQQTLADFKRTMANLQQISAQLSNNDGTLGLLLNDSTLYRRIDGAIISADSLLRDIQANPKRYVRFSLF